MMHKPDIEVIEEAAKILAEVADSGALPPSWRWPIIDELNGIAAIERDRVLTHN